MADSCVIRDVVRVVDAKKLRRAALASFLASWAEAMKLELVADDPADGSYDNGMKSKLTILSVGGIEIRKCTLFGISDLEAFALSNAPCLIISDLNDAEEMTTAAKAGFRGFITTDTEPDLAIRTLIFVLGGGVSFPREAILRERVRIYVDVKYVGDSPGSLTNLTPRQHEVLDCLCKGRSNKLIGRDLDMQESTVKVHVRQIMRKLGAANRTQVALFAGNRVNGHVPDHKIE